MARDDACHAGVGLCDEGRKFDAGLFEAVLGDIWHKYYPYRQYSQQPIPFTRGDEIKTRCHFPNPNAHPKKKISLGDIFCGVAFGLGDDGYGPKTSAASCFRAARVVSTRVMLSDSSLQRLQQLRLNRNLRLVLLQLRSVDQKRIFHALTERGDFRQLQVDAVVQQHTGDQVQQTGAVAG